MARIAVVVGTPLTESYCEALGRAYCRGAVSAGHDAAFFLLAGMHFDPVLREGYRREQPLEPELAAVREAFKAADHLVFVFPLWCGDMPALMKGFIERLLQPDLIVAQRQGSGAKFYAGKSARVIITMGMPGWFYRFYYGAYALKILKRNILHFVGVSPVRSAILGMVEATGGEKHARWLREVEALGRSAR